MSVWSLFLLFLKIGATGFGGGYAMLSLIKKEVVDKRHWINEDDFTRAFSVAQLSPGPVITNTSAFIGHQLKGSRGAIACVIGIILPSYLLITTLSGLYIKFAGYTPVAAFFGGISIGVIGILASIVIDLGKTAINRWTGVLIIIIVFIANIFFNVSPFIIIIGAGILGAALLRDTAQ